MVNIEVEELQTILKQKIKINSVHNNIINIFRIEYKWIYM